MSSSSSKHKPVAMVDSEFANDMSTYIEAFLEEEKENFRPGIETVLEQAERVRMEEIAALTEFYHRFNSGFQCISEALSLLKIVFPIPDEEQQQELASNLYQSLGYSQEDMNLFYKAACYYVQLNDFEKAKDAFYFLTALAPQSADLWLNLAICLTECAEYEHALEACLQSIVLNPEIAKAYLQAIYLYKQQGLGQEAQSLCKTGIDFAKAEANETLLQTLEQAITTI